MYGGLGGFLAKGSLKGFFELRDKGSLKGFLGV